MKYTVFIDENLNLEDEDLKKKIEEEVSKKDFVHSYEVLNVWNDDGRDSRIDLKLNEDIDTSGDPSFLDYSKSEVRYELSKLDFVHSAVYTY